MAEQDGSLLSRAFVADDEEDPTANFFEDDDPAAPAEATGDPLSTDDDDWPREAEFETDDQDRPVVIDEDGTATPLEAEAPGEQPGEPGEGDPAVDETPAGPTQDDNGLYLGRYESPDAMAQGFRQFQSWATQQQEQARAHQEALRSQLEQQDQQIDVLTQLVERTLSETDPETAQAVAQWRSQRETEKVLAERISQGVEEQVAPLRQQMAQREVEAAARTSVQTFYSNHPELEPRGPEDRQVAMTVSGMMQQGLPVDVTNPEHLEAALEAVRDPQFGAQLMMNPQAFQVPGAILNVIQRRRAAAPSQAPGQQQPPSDGGGAPAERKPVRRRVEAQVEPGSSGAPVPSAPGAKPSNPWGDDEFAEAAVALRGARSGSSVLFGSQRG